MRRDVFQALADPTRRTIIQILAKGPLTINKLAENFTISRPAISKQVKILKQCELLDIEQKGRERYCHIKLANFNTVNDWIGQYKELWMDEESGNLEEFLQQDQEAIKEEAIKKKKAEEEKAAKEEEKRQQAKKAKPDPYQYSLF